jgi:hypothetical protein
LSKGLIPNHPASGFAWVVLCVIGTQMTLIVLILKDKKRLYAFKNHFLSALSASSAFSFVTPIFTHHHHIPNP